MTSPYALRTLSRTPGFTVTVILTLALGLSAVAAMFAIVYGVLLAPLQYAEPDRLVSVGLQGAEHRRMGQPPAVFATYRQFAPSLAEIGYYRSGSTNVWSSEDGDAADSVASAWVTASLFALLRVTPVLGRSFSAEEEIRGESTRLGALAARIWAPLLAAEQEPRA